MTPNLGILSNDALIDLGAQLETELAQAQEQLDFEVGQLGPDQQRLIRPGVKLALTTAVGVAGITLAPITIGWSLALTVISSGVTIPMRWISATMSEGFGLYGDGYGTFAGLPLTSCKN